MCHFPIGFHLAVVYSNDELIVLLDAMWHFLFHYYFFLCIFWFLIVLLVFIAIINVFCDENMCFIGYCFVIILCSIAQQWKNHFVNAIYGQLYKTYCVFVVLNTNLNWMPFALSRQVRENLSREISRKFDFVTQRSMMNSKWSNHNLS